MGRKSEISEISKKLRNLEILKTIGNPEKNRKHIETIWRNLKNLEFFENKILKSEKS